MHPFSGEILIPGSTWAACLSALSWTLGLSSFINSKLIITCLRNNMYSDLLPDFPGKGESSTEGWGVTWEILGSDWGCHRRNLGKYCYIHGALLSSSICHSSFEDHFIWPWSIYISCIQNQASEMQIRRGSWAALCRKPVESVIPETVLDAWSWPCVSIIIINYFLWGGNCCI